MEQSTALRKGGAILSYLARHPNAEDTIDGIVQWWLLDQRIHDAMSEVQEILDWLVVKGFLIETKRTNDKSVYRINPEAYSQLALNNKT